MELILVERPANLPTRADWNERARFRRIASPSRRPTPWDWRPADLGPESRKGAAPGVFPKEHAMAPTDNGRQIPESNVEE
jgi:hypothetical protein